MFKAKALVALFGVLVVAAVPPSVVSAWAPPGQATVHPGVQVFTEGAQCTSNFVFEEGTEPFKANLVGAILGS